MRNESSFMRQRQYVVTSVLTMILVGGVFLRVSNLGGPDFGVDEMFHVYAAEGMMRGDAPKLPSGISYERSRDFTQTVAWAASLFGDLNERTARIPSVVFGCLTIVVVFLIGRRWYSDTAGLVAAGVTAVAPMQVAFSRQVRMYAMFQLLYLIVVFLLFEAIESPSTSRVRVSARVSSWWRALEIRPGLLLVAAPVVFLAWRTQNLILPALTGPAAYVLCMAAVARFAKGIAPPIKLKYYAASMLVILGAVTCLMFGLGWLPATLDFRWLQRELARARYAPTWAQPNSGNWRFYVYDFADKYPIIFSAFLPSTLFAFTRNWKASLYIIACVAAPFFLHSFMFAWKEDRYLFHVMPLMFVVFGVGVTALVSALHKALEVWSTSALEVSPRVVATTLTMAAVIFLFGATKELREGIKLHNINTGTFWGVQHYHWKKTMAFVGERGQPQDVVITSRTLTSRYYGPDRPLYLLNFQELDAILDTYPRGPDRTPLDKGTLAPVILDVEMLQDVVRQHPSGGWVVTEGPQFETATSTPPEIAKFIEAHFESEPVPEADDMVLFHWGPFAKRSASIPSTAKISGRENLRP